jgi:hypothetical protein
MHTCPIFSLPPVSFHSACFLDPTENGYLHGGPILSSFGNKKITGDLPVIQSKGKTHPFQNGWTSRVPSPTTPPFCCTKGGNLYKKERQIHPPFCTFHLFPFNLRIMKKGQTGPVYSAHTSRAFEQYLLTCSKSGNAI